MATKIFNRRWQEGYCAFQADDEIRIYARAHGDREAIDRCKSSIQIADNAILKMISGGTDANIRNC